jgi:DMSO/TMAO reductase YedYZ molybdopterin-dependent catalytic subunit
MTPISRGFRRRHTVPEGASDRVPPGQYVTDGFPVLSAGPTPHTPLTEWTFSIRQGAATLKSWTWQEFQELPAQTVTVDIHCVTRWSKLDTEWRGVSVAALLAEVRQPDARYVTAFSDGGYTTNLPLADVTDGKAWVAFGFGGGALEPEHGGPARLLVPHLYFWKSAKWVRGLELMNEDKPGFWETYGYHMYGDPWKEQRYQGD